MAKTVSELVRELVGLEMRIILQTTQVQFFPKAEQEMREDEVEALIVQRDQVALELDSKVQEKV